MKMPVKKAERIKIMVLIAIGIIAVLFTVIQLVILPLKRSYDDKQAKLAAAKMSWAEKSQEVDRSPRIHKEYREVLAAVDQYSGKYVMHPTLGTYLIGAQNLIETMCTNSGIQIDNIAEIGEAEVPGRNKDGTPHIVKSYSVRMTGFAGFSQITNFIAGLERDNRMASFTDLQVSARDETPELHKITCIIQWPVWADADKGTDSTIVTNMAARQSSSTTGAASGNEPAGKVWE